MVKKGMTKIQPISTPQVKALLESLGEENLDQFQRRSLDYTSKFSKTDLKTAEKLLSKLQEEEKLKIEEAVQIVCCMPRSIEELRVFLAGGRRIVETSKLESILKLLDKHREFEEK
jgi:DNA-directed RNA polymerase subunit F